MALNLRVAFSCPALLLSLLLCFPALAKSQNKCTYDISVKTSWDEGSGTDSKVTLQVFESSGRNFNIEDLKAYGKMEFGHDYFERNNMEFFGIETECLNPCKIFVAIDGAGSRPEWHLEYVEIKVAKGNDFGAAGFPVFNWLAVGFPAVVDYCPPH